MPKRVLTVDDSETMREMVGFTLRRAGFGVSEATDDKQAMALLKTATADIIVTDRNMPNMEGF